MTREHAKELLPIITAFANGEEIQVKFKDEPRDTWEKTVRPTFDASQYDYRIKPKPSEWFMFRDCGDYWKIQSEAPSAKWDEIIKVREILD